MLGIHPMSPKDSCSTLVCILGVPSPDLCAVYSQLLGCNPLGADLSEREYRAVAANWRPLRACRQVKGKASPQSSCGFARPCEPFCCTPGRWFSEDCVVGRDEGEDMHRSDFSVVREQLVGPDDGPGEVAWTRAVVAQLASAPHILRPLFILPSGGSC